MGALSFPIEFLSGSGGVTEAALAAIDAWDPTAISASTYSAVAGEARVFTHATGCDVTLPTGASNGMMIAVRTGHATGYVKFVTGGGSSKVQSETTQIAGKIGLVMIAQATENANEWNITGHDPEGPVYIGEYDTFDLLQASAFANGGAALYALPQNSTASIREFIAGTGRGGILKRSYAAAQADVHWTSDSEIILFQAAVASGQDVVYPANVSVVGVSSASAGAKTRVNMTGHGLTAASNGIGIAVTGGTNWTAGRYAMTYVDADNFDLDVAWNAGFGVPTITKATGSTQITDLLTLPSIPAGMRQKNSVTVVEAQFETSATSGSKYTQVKHGGVQIHNGLIDVTNASESVRINMRNCGNKAVQVQQATSISTSYTKAGAVSRTTVDTAVAQAVVLGIDMPAANIWARVAGATLSVRI